MRGKLIKGIAGFYYVHVEGKGIYSCKAKGIFRKEGIKPLVGDNVEIEVLDEAALEGNLIKIEERNNSLMRPAVANIDQAMVIFAVKKPDPDFKLLDKFLIMMEQQGLPLIICFNKMDLSILKEQEELQKIYELCGYQVIFTNALNNEGMEQLALLLSNKTTAVAGPSGVGKSSLINVLQPDISMETGELSEKLKRGKHTTRHSQLIFVSEKTYIMDTPGFSSLSLNDMDQDELSSCYHEFDLYQSGCKFQGCMHIHEPGCKVKEAVEQGKISKLRYENYQAFYEELKNKRKY